MLSKADEMFKELGYNHYIDYEELKEDGIYESFSKSDRQWRKDGYMEITFDNGDIFILFKEKDRADQLPIYITAKELQVINEKVKELGWLDE